MTYAAGWSEQDAQDAARDLFTLAYPLTHSMAQVNPAQDALVRNILANSINEILLAHDEFHFKAFVSVGAPRKDDVCGRANSSYLYEFYTDLKDRLLSGQPFSDLSRRLGNHSGCYFALIPGDDSVVPATLFEITSPEQLDIYLDRMREAGVDPIAIALSHSLVAALIASSRRPIPGVSYARPLNQPVGGVRALRGMIGDTVLLQRPVIWFRVGVDKGLTAIAELGLLDDLTPVERQMFEGLVTEWSGTIGELKNAAVNLTHSS